MRLGNGRMREMDMFVLTSLAILSLVLLVAVSFGWEQYRLHHRARR